MQKQKIFERKVNENISWHASFCCGNAEFWGAPKKLGTKVVRLGMRRIYGGVKDIFKLKIKKWKILF